MVPAEIGEDLGTDYDWQLLTTEQEYLDGHAVRLNQGKVLGGGTILNGMVWTRSSARDYDVWAELNENGTQAAKYSWRWADLLPYFKKVRAYFLTNERWYLVLMIACRARTSAQKSTLLPARPSAFTPIRQCTASVVLSRLDFRISSISSMVGLPRFLALRATCSRKPSLVIELTLSSELPRRHETDGSIHSLGTKQRHDEWRVCCAFEPSCAQPVALGRACCVSRPGH